MATILKTLCSRKSLAILGINSGTSADGIDLALITFRNKRGYPEIAYIDGSTIEYPRSLKADLEKAIQGDNANCEAIARLDMAYGRYLGMAAAAFIKSRKHSVDLIASHGQTVGHYPASRRLLGLSTRATKQIGDGNAIAVETKIPVVTDFRQADIALGGEGAPLTPFVNQLLFGAAKRSRIIVNIGGIANFSYHPAGNRRGGISGADCGPGNTLSDLICRLQFGQPYDKNGRLAGRGKVVKELIDPIFEANKGRGVSTGRERFDSLLMARLVYLSRRHRAGRYDLITSAAEATVRLIHRLIRKFLSDRRLEGIYLTGGGRRNLYLADRLHYLCHPVPVFPIEALGYNGDYLEAVSFAVLGGCFVHGIPSVLPQVSGGRVGGVAGKLSLPPE